MKSRLLLISLFILPFLISGCSVSKSIRSQLQKTEKERQYHTGLLVLDPETGKSIVSWHEKLFFTPASNMKIYTLYSCLSVLGDSLPGLQYRIEGDSLFFQGTGDPTLLHPDLPESRVLDFLKSSPSAALVFCHSPSSDGRYGTGWAWDDFGYSFQAEKSALPLFGNVVRITAASPAAFHISPNLPGMLFTSDSSETGILREEFDNVFRYSPGQVKFPLKRDLPFRITGDITLSLLREALNKNVQSSPYPLRKPFSTLYSASADTVYRKMMYDSDNMIAEQLLYVYAAANRLPLRTGTAIAHALEHHLRDLPDTVIWKDGSGLSRYNLTTPRNTVFLLKRLYEKIPPGKLMSLFPAGGKSGTIRNMFKGTSPFVYAKSGSLGNQYNLSGYLYTRKGRVLIFSFMNNHFIEPGQNIRSRVEEILETIHRKL